MDSSTPYLSPAPCSTVTLRLAAQKLKDKDVFSKSDPMCVIFRWEGAVNGHGKWREIGRTECIQNCLSPEWGREIETQYFFEEKQLIKFEVYDIDNKSHNLSSQDFLGRMECDLAEIVSVGTFSKKLTGLKGDCGSITVTSEEKDEGGREMVVFEVRAEKVDKKDFFGKSDPYLNMYRMNPDGSRTMMHRTEFIRRTLNPTWKPFEITVKTMCENDKSRNIFVECWDNDDGKSSKPDFIGSCTIQVAQLLQSSLSVPLINPKKQAKKGKKYNNSGLLHLRTRVVLQTTFVDYIVGGTQLDFSVAIDFTASNGPVNNPNSLHFINPQTPNQYEVAIRSILEICQYYNNSKIFDSFGFGAVLPPNRVMTPLFDLSYPQPVLSNPSVVGVQGVLSSYRNCLHNVQLYGPTNFAPIIREVSKRTVSKTKIPGSRYQILLIITDGVISDLQHTKKAIIEACHLPISIIIIGVGNANFDAMDELDGDSVRISVDGRFAERDIVQFVPLRQFLNNANVQPERVMALLAKEVLAEVPSQLLSYMRSRNISPRPATAPFDRDAPAEMEPIYDTASPYAPVPQPHGYSAPPQQTGSNMAYQPANMYPPTAAPPYPPAVQHMPNVQSSAPQGIYPSAPPIQ